MRSQTQVSSARDGRCACALLRDDARTRFARTFISIILCNALGRLWICQVHKSFIVFALVVVVAVAAALVWLDRKRKRKTNRALLRPRAPVNNGHVCGLERARARAQVMRAAAYSLREASVQAIAFVCARTHSNLRAQTLASERASEPPRRA